MRALAGRFPGADPEEWALADCCTIWIMNSIRSSTAKRQLNPQSRRL
jgi:hypothetical protein